MSRLRHCQRVLWCKGGQNDLFGEQIPVFFQNYKSGGRCLIYKPNDGFLTVPREQITEADGVNA